MQKVLSGNVVFISGPPFAGKTYLVTQLAECIENCKVVNYELFFRSGGYPEFYQRVVELARAGHFVLAESVNNFTGYECDDSPSMDGIECLHVVAMPSLKRHEENYRRFVSFAGKRAGRDRTGPKDVAYYRDTLKLPKTKYHTYTCENYNEIKEVVLSHAIYNEQDSDS